MPVKMGLGSDTDEYPYSQITSVKLAKGMMSHAIYLTIPGLTKVSKEKRKSRMWGRKDAGVIDALPKKTTIRLNEILQEKIAEFRDKEHQVPTQPAQEDPMNALKMRLVKGEIDKKELG